ncbi:MAG: hypothetical protein RB294_07665 [Bacteroidales bacterium]|jgi:hypothetical protein|nr:hypothetical protein [Bacteroidales bacterium]HPB03067.1 hypothetical protein [Bacteroidales bacterium]
MTIGIGGDALKCLRILLIDAPNGDFKHSITTFLIQISEEYTLMRTELI